MEGNKIRFRYGTPVTNSPPYRPSLDPGSFVFDSKTWALYIDTEDGRKLVTDITKLSLSGGQVTGTVEVVSGGATRISLDTSGVITGQYLDLTGDLEIGSLDLYNYIAVVDTNNRIKGISLERLSDDLNVPDILASGITETLFIKT